MKNRFKDARVIDSGSENYGKRCYIRNCFEEDGEYYYMVCIKENHINTRLVVYHTSQIELLEDK